jgi:hypothetical protein
MTRRFYEVSMRRITHILQFVLILGCSSVTEISTSDYERIDKQKVASGMPNYYLMDFKFKKEASRAPAAIRKDEPTAVGELKNRKLYFMTLYSQYLWMGKVLDKKDDLKYCPQFHHEKVVFNSSIGQLKSRYSDLQLKDQKIESFDQKDLPFFPEMALVVKEDKIKQRNLDAQLRSGLERHFEVNEKELKILCERGRSDNFYVFSNLNDHFQKNPNFHYSKEAFKALLKTPIFSNILLFHSMLGDRMKTAKAVSYYPYEMMNEFEKEIVKRVDVGWVKQYLVAIKNKRMSTVARLRR